MNSFVNLWAVYDRIEDRNIGCLSQKYNDITYLKEVVCKLTFEYINSESVNGKFIFLKPNWVNHNINQDDDICLRTHNNLIIALIQVVLELNPSKITIGDAPIQGCNWRKVCPEVFIKEIEQLSETYQIPVIIQDFRKVIFDSKNNRLTKEMNPNSSYIIFDVGKQSFLEPISEKTRKPFRVAHYDYKRLAEVHRKGIHKYCITKTLFEADMVISMPKVKTHQKAGITAALKNMVGLNGDKDYLPHHRIGGTKKGGDSYPGNNVVRNFSELLLDISNKNIGEPTFRFWQKMAISVWKLATANKEVQWGAAWFGNDTVWRMVLDINKIAIYGRLDGTIADVPQRQVFSLCDGIIGGQGDGPLLPEPLPLGILSFSNNAALNDLIFTFLMRFNPEKIALVKNSFELYKYNFENVFMNGNKIRMIDLNEFTLDTLPPPGWVEHLKNEI